MKLVINDGGRKAAGYKGQVSDCVTRAIAIAAQMDYREVYDDINDLSKQERKIRGRSRSSATTGVNKPTYKRYLIDLGWKWHATMHIGSGCKVHLDEKELPAGRLIVCVSKHVLAVIDGVMHDLYDPSRDGTRCVYGYWTKESK